MRGLCKDEEKLKKTEKTFFFSLSTSIQKKRDKKIKGKKEETKAKCKETQQETGEMKHSM